VRPFAQKSERTARSRPSGHDKLIWLVNLALLFAMTLCVASGIAISGVALPELGIATLQTPFWFRLHALTAEVTVGVGLANTPDLTV